jgi:AcrR family transcriptional regulator
VPRIRARSIDEHKVLVRGQILAATRELLADTGSADLNLGELAAIAEIGRTTIYEYFRDRDDLIASLVEEELPAVISALIGRLNPNDAGSERLLRIAELTVEFVATDQVLGLILHREVPRLSFEAQNRIRMAHNDLSTAMVRFYLEAVESGSFRPMPPDLAGRLLHDLTMSAARFVIAFPDRLPEVTASLRQFLAGGFAAGSR